MKSYSTCFVAFLAKVTLLCSALHAANSDLPAEIQKIMNLPKYEHSIWGIYAKDLTTGEVYFDVNSDRLFSPASTTKLFSVAALLHAFGDDYRFKTPVYSLGVIDGEKLTGDLVLVAQGDLTMGGRESGDDKISFTKMDHIIANDVPGAILTKEDPLQGLNALAKQIFQKGIKEIDGDIIIDDSLFESIQKRDMLLTPIIINENLIDLVVNPSKIGQKGEVTWRPVVPGYSVTNHTTTVEKDEPLVLKISSDDQGHNLLIEGTIPLGEKDVVRTFSIKDPKSFARAAFIHALELNGVKVVTSSAPTKTPSQSAYKDLRPVAEWTSPPLTEYAKLILKVSHNLGADLIPLLLASHSGKKTFTEGMRLLGNFVVQEVKIPLNAFVFIDGAGGNENRLTPQAEIQLLDYVHKQKPSQFQHFFDALPILGVDGSLEDFGKKTPASGKVRAKPGTGIAFNLATDKFFLITQAFAGYLEGKNNHLFAYIVVVNNATMPTIDDAFAIFEDEAQLSNAIYLYTDKRPQGSTPEPNSQEKSSVFR